MMILLLKEVKSGSLSSIKMKARSKLLLRKITQPLFTKTVFMCLEVMMERRIIIKLLYLTFRLKNGVF